MCGAHNKELELVCTQSSHSTTMICISCAVTSHNGHSCATATDYFVGKQTDVQELIARAKATEAKLEQGMDLVSKEQRALITKQETVQHSIRDYFAKAHSMLDLRQNELLSQLESTIANKSKVLLAQQDGFQATLEEIKQESHLLGVSLSVNSQAKTLVLMEQLQQHLISMNADGLQPRELAEIEFQETSLILPQLHLFYATSLVKYSWSTTKKENIATTNTTIESNREGAWGMISEEFGMQPQTLTLRVNHRNTSKWSYIVLGSSALAFKSGSFRHPSASHAIHKGMKDVAVTLLKLQREKDGQVTLHQDGNEIWKKQVPECFVYVDVFYPATVAEIVQ